MPGKCPACGEILIALELEGFEVDYCPACRGTWLDAGELDLIAERAGAADHNLEQELREARGSRHGGRRCPRCRARLDLVHAGCEGRVELDRCPRGHGLWLDAGEIEHVIASFQEGQEAAVADFLADLFGKKRPRPESPDASRRP